MSEASAALDLGFEVNYKGQRYTFASLDTVEVVGRFEAYLEDQAWDALERAKAKRSAAFYAEQAKGIRTDISAGAYHYGNDGWRTAMGSRHHQKHLLLLMLQHNQHDADAALLDEMWKDRATREELARKLIADFARAEGLDPNELLAAAGKPPGRPGTTSR